MAKLIFVNPDDLQDVMEIGQGGGCNDKKREIWNENVDGPAPEKAMEMLGGLVRKGKELLFDPDMKALQDKKVEEMEKAKEQEIIEQKLRLEQIRALEKAEDLETVCVGLRALCKELGYFY